MKPRPWFDVLVTATIAAVAVFASAFVSGACYVLWGNRKARQHQAELLEWERQRRAELEQRPADDSRTL